jgi:hypothetical protein
MSDFTKDAVLTFQVSTDIQRIRVSDKHTATMVISQSYDKMRPGTRLNSRRGQLGPQGGEPHYRHFSTWIVLWVIRDPISNLLIIMWASVPTGFTTGYFIHLVTLCDKGA